MLKDLEKNLIQIIGKVEDIFFLKNENLEKKDATFKMKF